MNREIERRMSKNDRFMLWKMLQALNDPMNFKDHEQLIHDIARLFEPYGKTYEDVFWFIRRMYFIATLELEKMSK